MKRVPSVIAVGILITSVAHAADAPVQRLSTAGRGSQLKAVRLRSAGDSVQVVFVVDGAARYKSTRSAQPPRITIDMPGTAISPLLTHREFLSRHAALVRVLLVRTAGSTRAILDLAAAGPYTIYNPQGSGQIVVDIRTAGREAAALPKSPTPAARAAPIHSTRQGWLQNLIHPA